MTAITKPDQFDVSLALADTPAKVNDLDGKLKAYMDLKKVDQSFDESAEQARRFAGMQVKLAWWGGQLLLRVEPGTGGAPYHKANRDVLRHGRAVPSSWREEIRKAGIAYAKGRMWLAIARAFPTEQALEEVLARPRLQFTSLYYEARNMIKRRGDAERVATLEAPTGVHRTLAIDPPWDPKDTGDSDVAGRSAPTYATMSLDEIAALPVPDHLTDDAHVYLCVTNRTMPFGFGMLSGWGLRYITTITWCKTGAPGTGSYFRNNTEHVLFAVRGDLTLRVTDQPTWFTAPRGEHSEKPDELYDIIRRCSYGPYGEWFGRKEREGWNVWGLTGADADDAS